MRSVPPFAFRAVCALALLQAGDASARPFKDLCEQFEPLRKLGDLKYVKPVVRIVANDGAKASDVVFTIAAKGGEIRVAPAADGSIAFPFTEKLCAENPNVEMNRPKGSISLNISIDPSVPAASSFQYRLLADLRAEWDEAIRRQSLMWRMLAPGPKGFQVNFEPGKAASAEVRLPQGVRRLLADAKGELRIPFEEAWLAANPTIVLSEMPRRIGLAFKN